MKRFLLLVMIIGLANVLFAQGPLQLFDHDGNYITNGQELFVHVEDLSAFETVSEEYFIRNNSNADMELKCLRTVVSEVEGTSNYFCALGSCLAPFTDETPNAYLLAANTTIGELEPFSAHYSPNNIGGFTVLNYKFYNTANPNDSISFTITFSENNVAKNSLQLFDENGNEIMYGENIEVTVDDLSLFETVSPESFIRNNSDRAISVKCRRTELLAVEGTSNYFCALGACLAPFTDESPEALELDAFTTIDELNPFSSHYSPDNNPGTSVFHYRYFDVMNVYDEFSFTVTFDGTTSIGEIEESSVQAYPNPSNGLLSFSFDNNINDNSILNIYNLQGQKLRSIHINNTATLDVDLSDLPKGMYFYQIENANIASSKIIIE